MKKFILSFFIIAVLFITNITAYASNNDYFQEETWIDNPNVCSETINKTSNFGVLDGTFNYYFDAYNNIFYTYFSITESTISNNNCDVRISYVVSNVFDLFRFSVDKNGINDTSNNENDYFVVKQSFTDYAESKGGSYITAVQINNGCLRNSISIKLYVNGHVYKIADNIEVEKLTENDAVSNEYCDDQGISNTSANVKSTVKSTKKSSFGKSTKTRKISTTKFHYYPNNKSTNKVIYSPDNAAGNIVYDDNSEYKAMSANTAKAFYIMGAACAVAGVVFVTIAVLSKSDKNKDNDKKSE